MNTATKTIGLTTVICAVVLSIPYGWQLIGIGLPIYEISTYAFRGVIIGAVWCWVSEYFEEKRS